MEQRFAKGVLLEVDEYEVLIRESERLAVIRRLIEGNQYISTTDLRNVLAMESEDVNDGTTEDL